MLFASEELPDNERELFFRHMGHSRDINEQIYQVPPAIREVTKKGIQVDTFLKYRHKIL